MLAPPPVRTTRRRVLAVAAATGSAALAASACEVVDDPGPPSAGRAPGGSGNPSPSAAPAGDTDEQLVVAVAEDVAATLAVVTAAGRDRPALGRALRGLARTHRAHLGELPAPAAGRRVRFGGDDQEALRRVRSAEHRLQRRLADAALAAESGGLAALLASMAAAVAQRLASEPLA